MKKHVTIIKKKIIIKTEPTLRAQAPPAHKRLLRGPKWPQEAQEAAKR